MVRVFLKGGVWKNAEDEVLKAAVQKYGKADWARVASLLNKKSAKQCKARWLEWLDPSVRKIEWSREEEEKLLHLAKLLPAQWKTIGPIVGRTATQCQEHYEELLDAAAGGDAAGGDDETNALRQQPLRAGQIDSHPESKPARPDPIDMDEDEIEMLQEARARLANTQGKKAKRKAREKMLQQAKRLAELQKRRELKQAGLMSSQAKRKAKRKNRDIDLGVEIPFHKPAPAGFHDTGGEAVRSEALRQNQMKSVNFKQLNEQQYRSRDREEALSKKREEARIRTLERTNMQYVVAQVSKTNDPLHNARKRGPMSLPAPTVTDDDIKQLSKMGAANANAGDIAGGSGATATLLADYSDRPLPTPMRTPMTGGSASKAPTRMDSILREANNLRTLERGQTPLLGGDNAPLVETVTEDDEEDGKPSARPATPGGPNVVAGNQTPRRDHFGLNRPQSELRSAMDDDASVGASTFATSTTMSIREQAREERRAAKRARMELVEALAALPAPQFDYELETPADMDLDDDPMAESGVLIEDKADIEARERKCLQQEADELYEARSSVVKRSDLPRPVGAIPDSAQVVMNDPTDVVIEQERISLLRHDAHAFPVEAEQRLASDDKKKKKKDKKKSKPSKSEVPPTAPLDILDERALTAAKELIQAELAALITEKSNSLLSSGATEQSARMLLHAETIKARHGDASTTVFANGEWQEKTKLSELESCALEFDTIQEAAAAQRKKNQKLESKLAVLTGGFVKRSEVLTKEILRLYGDHQNSVIEGSVYSKLRKQEELGAVKRIDALRSDISRLEQDTMNLQATHDRLTGVHEDDDDDFM